MVLPITCREGRAVGDSDPSWRMLCHCSCRAWSCQVTQWQQECCLREGELQSRISDTADNFWHCFFSPQYVPKDLLPVYRDKVVPVADIITPNQFEAE